MKMSVMFLREDVAELLSNKFVVVMGGSIQRSVYKDLIKLIQSGFFLTDKQLRAKGEQSIVQDKLVFKSIATNGIGYREVREYLTGSHYLYFIFMTRCYNTYVESMLQQLSGSEPKPDVIVINSCLWDLTRYGDNAIPQYKENLCKLFGKLAELFPDTLVIWATNPPIATNPKGGVFVPETEHLKCQMELNVIEANFCARELAAEHGHDVLDLHYYLRHQIHRRAEDGIHWDMTGHRRMSNLLLTHIAEAWNVTLPHHLHNYYNSIEEKIENVENQYKENRIPLDFDEVDGAGNEKTPADSECYDHQPHEDWNWHYGEHTDYGAGNVQTPADSECYDHQPHEDWNWHYGEHTDYGAGNMQTPVDSECYDHQPHEDWNWHNGEHTDYGAHYEYTPPTPYDPIHDQQFTPDYQDVNLHVTYDAPSPSYPSWSVEAQNQRWGLVKKAPSRPPIPPGPVYRHTRVPRPPVLAMHARPTGWSFRPKFNKPYPSFYENRLVRRYQPY